MKIHLSQDTFIRHYLNESFIFDQHSAGQLLLEDAGTFLRFITRIPTLFDTIVSETAAAIGIGIDEIESDFRTFIDTLLSYGFIVSSMTDDAIGGVSAVPSTTISSYDPLFPVEDTFATGEFYGRNQLPYQLHIDLTDACNENCVHCYIPKGKHHHFIPFERVEKVLREFRELQGMEVIFSGGEPMLHPQFEAIMHLARETDLAISVYSNLTICDREKTDFLRELNIRSLQVSIYSMNPSFHDAITRVPGSLKKTMDGLHLLLEAGVPVWINTPVLRENFEGYCEVVRFVRENGIRMRTNYGEIYARADHDTANLSHMLTASEMLAFLEKNSDLIGESLYYTPPGQLDPEASVCEIMTDHICLDSQGMYYPCESCHEYVLGDCAQFTLQEIWTSSKAVYLRNLKNKDFPECTECPTRRNCHMCIMHAFNDTGSLFRHSPMQCVAAKIRADFCNRITIEGV